MRIICLNPILNIILVKYLLNLIVDILLNWQKHVIESIIVGEIAKTPSLGKCKLTPCTFNFVLLTTELFVMTKLIVLCYFIYQL